MDDTANLGVFLEYGFRSIEVTEVHLFESRTNAGYFLDAIDDISTRVGEVVDDNNVVTCVLQLYGGVGADKTCSTSYEDSLFHTCILVLFLY